MVSGDQPQRRKGREPAEEICQTLTHRMQLPGYQGSTLWHGMGQVHVNSPERRDRLWLLNALAIALLTLLGAAGEALGFDKHLKP